MNRIPFFDLVSCQGIRIFQHAAGVDETLAVRRYVRIVGARELRFQVQDSGGEGNGEDVFGFRGGFDVESDGGFVGVGGFVCHGDE